MVLNEAQEQLYLYFSVILVVYLFVCMRHIILYSYFRAVPYTSVTYITQFRVVALLVLQMAELKVHVAQDRDL
jgi:hypothetical protein